MHQSLREKKAESDYTIAEFYWKQGWYDSAEVYYKNIVANFPDTATAKKAADRIEMIEKKAKK